MRWLYTTSRAIVVAFLVLLVAVPAVLYVLVQVPAFQDAVARRVESELSRLLGTGVSVGRVGIEPFNRVTLSDVVVLDRQGRHALAVRRLGAGIDLYDLIAKGDIVVTYAEIISARAMVCRDSAGAPLNIQPIIDHLKPKDKNKPPTQFDLAVRMVLVRGLAASYDVLSAPAPRPGRFDPNHVAVTGLNADLHLPRIKNDDFEGQIKRLTARERSGLELKELRGDFVVTATGARVRGLAVETPRSRLAFNDMALAYRSFQTIGEDLKTADYDVELLAGSHVTPADFAPLLPALASLASPVAVELHAAGRPDSMAVPHLAVTAREGRVRLSCNRASVEGLLSGDLRADVRRLSLSAKSADILDVARLVAELPPQAVGAIEGCGQVNLLADVRASRPAPGAFQASVKGSLLTDAGNLDIDGEATRRAASTHVNATLSTPGFDPSRLLPQTGGVGRVALEARADVTLGGKTPTGTASVDIASAEWRGNTYQDIMADVEATEHAVAFTLNSADPKAQLSLDGALEFGDTPGLEATAHVERLELRQLLSRGKLRDQVLSFAAALDFSGRDVDSATGWLNLDQATLTAPDGTRRRVDDVALAVSGGENLGEGHTPGASPEQQRLITLRSPIVDGRVAGEFSLTRLGAVARDIFARAYPALAGETPSPTPGEPKAQRLTFSLALKSDSLLASLFPLPVSLLDTVKITGQLNSGLSLMSLSVHAPYLRKGNKLVEDTQLYATVAGGEATLVAGTTMPSKFGPMTLSVNAQGRSDTTSLSLGWRMDNPRRYEGRFDLDVALGREDIGEQGRKLTARVDFRPTDIAINDTVWRVSPATITARPGRVSVEGFSISRPGQYIRLDGTASADTADAVNLRLRDIDLDYVFETLNIPNVAFGGRATGDFVAARLFSGVPLLSTTGEGLRVQNLSYNHCVMGDGVIQSAWHPENQGITIDAVITERGGGDAAPPRSVVHGLIRPMAEELDFRFQADRAPVGFMQPFMAAFTSRISGRVSGQAHLYGTFSLLDMVGDIYAQDLNMRLDFTNTTYTVNDSVHMAPGLITFNDVAMADRYGNTARVSGRVTHKCFKEPTFNFNVTGARNLLVYDVPAGGEDPWYGRIFGNGAAYVNGVPGQVDIRVNMTTARGVPGAGSDFTFVLSDSEIAAEYGFITFRDADQGRKDSIAALDATPLAVRLLRDRVKRAAQDAPSVYKMDFNVGVTPDTRINLVMDPVGGDVITAYGAGNMRMTYDSDGELRMFGQYVLDRGSYLFTLQDIIKKYFTIRAGSSITFNGDPYAARLDITAQYDVRTNLTDLDESFATDRELSSTVVNVNALLHAAGDMRSPDITFDLDFPNLSDEVRRKVRSIVSTDDMMNRQIIYLLGLGRFYTPDYTNATRGSELASLASSTISSQLASMLGQLSDNWTIAPQFRSDRGDFSDVEVDVALSSHLLNNRLLFNGNLGYRDKSLNNNTFVGDFDIEYLLNRSGSIRLKAYNRYNDQTYYLKSALTTQGVGLVYKRDFDDMFRFLRRRPRPAERRDTTVVVTDSLLIFK